MEAVESRLGCGFDPCYAVGMHLLLLRPHRCSAGSVGTQTSSCRVNKGVSFLLHRFTCACLLPRGTGGECRVLGTHPLCYRRATCSQGIGGRKNALAMAEMTQLEVPLSLTLWELVYTLIQSDLPPDHPRSLRRRRGWNRSLPNRLP